MILKAKHNVIIYPFFKWYSKYIIRKHFQKVLIKGDVKVKDLPVLIISNHVSWWDGFWVMYLNLKIFRKRFHFMMLEEQLKKYWFFRYSGGFSVNRNSRTILESLDYAGNLLNNNDNLVLIFPQGKIQSVYQQEIQFEKGVERIIRSTACDIQIIFLVNLVDYFSSYKPNIFMYLEEFNFSDNETGTIQDHYELFFKVCIDAQKHIDD